MGLQDTLRRYSRAVARRTRDRLALQAYAALVHGPLQELASEVAGLRADLARAEAGRLAEQEHLSVTAGRLETVLEEVRGLREEVERIGRPRT